MRTASLLTLAPHRAPLARWPRAEGRFEGVGAQLGRDGDVRSLGGSQQEPVTDQRSQDGFTGRRIQLPETTRLRKGETQPGHFSELTADASDNRFRRKAHTTTMPPATRVTNQADPLGERSAAASGLFVCNRCRRMDVLVIDVGGSAVTFRLSTAAEVRRFRSGTGLTPEQLVETV